MSEFSEKISAMENSLAGSATFDRFLMDRAFSQLSGLDLGQLDPKLRRKLEEDQKSPRHILTVYGLGYKLVP